MAAALLLAGETGAGAQAVYTGDDTTFYIDCLRNQADLLDDRISDAKSISTAIVAICRTMRIDFLRQTQPKSLVIDVLSRPATTKDIDNGVVAVLQQRAARR